MAEGWLVWRQAQVVRGREAMESNRWIVGRAVEHYCQHCEPGDMRFCRCCAGEGCWSGAPGEGVDARAL